MDKEALEIIGGLYVETARLKDVISKFKEALQLKTQEYNNLLNDKQDKKILNESTTARQADI